MMRHVGDVALALHRLPQPTIAKVGGVAAGAGANMAFGCDLIVASDEARFTEIFARRGLTIDFGGSWLLPRLIGLHKAKELAFFADIISAKEAEAFGLVNRVVPAGELDAFVDDWAQQAGRRAAHRPGADEAAAQQLHVRSRWSRRSTTRARPRRSTSAPPTPPRPWPRSWTSATPASPAADVTAGRAPLGAACGHDGAPRTSLTTVAPCSRLVVRVPQSSLRGWSARCSRSASAAPACCPGR